MNKITAILILLVLFLSLTLVKGQHFQDKFISYAPVKLNDGEKAAVKKYVDQVNYDPVENMVLSKITAWQYHIDTVGVTYHHVLSTFRYAKALLNLEDPNMVPRACEAILAGIAQQDTVPGSKTLGVWPYYKEEPLATKRSPADFNMADFNAAVLLDIYMGYQNQLPATVLEKIKKALILAARSIEKRNMGPGYTNIAIMGTYVTYMVSHLFDLADMQAYASKRLKNFYNYTIEKNGFSEYNSPTYTITALDEITRMLRHIVEPEDRKMVVKLNEVAWDIMARHFHKPTGQWAGPNSRSYSTFLNQEKFFSILYFSSKGKVDFGFRNYNAAEILLRYEMPEKYVAWFNSPAYPRTEHDLFEPGEPQVKGTTFLEKDFVLSSANRSCMWNQRRPFTAYWGTMKSPRYMQVQFLHDDYDFSSAAMFSYQAENRILAGINLYLDGGDKHIGIDKIKDRKIKGKDLRIRFKFGGTSSDKDFKIPPKGNTAFTLPVDGFNFNIHLFQASFNKENGFWEKGSDGKDAWVDYVIYSGREKEIDLSAIQEAAWAFTFSMTRKGEKIPASKPEYNVENNEMKVSWGALNISIPVNLLPLGPYPKNL